MPGSPKRPARPVRRTTDPARTLPALLLASLLLSGCAAPLETLQGCRYPVDPSAVEFAFSLPSLEQAVTGTGATPLYTRPDRASLLRPSSWRYSREFVGHRYQALDQVDGRDGRYTRWLLDDCRLLYSPLPSSHAD